MQTVLNKTRIDAFVIFCVGLFIFTIGLAHQEFISFESRFALFAKEMWQHGFTWFPQSYHQPYPDYPVTGIAFIYFSSHLFGQLNKFTAVFPSAVAAAFTLVATYLIGALRQRRWGWYGVFFLLLTMTFVSEARTISLDEYITAVTAFTFYLMYSAQQTGKYRRLYWLPLLLIFGFFCRGPIGLIIPTSVVCMFYLLKKDFKKLFLFGLLALGLLIIGSGLILVLAQHVGGPAFMHDVLNLEILSRMQKSGNAPATYYYFVESFGAYALTFPMAILVFLGLWKVDKVNEVDWRLIKKLLAWVLMIMVGMTIPGDKKIRYILAISPALALISAYLFVMPRESKYLQRLYRFFNGFLFLWPWLGMFVTLIMFYMNQQRHWEIDASYFSAGLGFAFLAGMSLLKLPKREGATLLFAALSLLLAYILLVEPINLHLNGMQNFVKTLEIQRRHAQADLVFYKEDPDGWSIKYLVDAPGEVTPVFLNDPQQLMSFQHKAYFIAGEEEFAGLPPAVAQQLQVLVRAKVGRRQMVVFTR